MMRHLLRLVAWRHLTRAPLRSGLTVIGTAIAVAGMVAISSANTAVLSSYEHSMEDLSGRVDLEVGSGEASFSEALLEPLSRIRGVTHISPVIEAKAHYAASNEPFLVLGVDLTGDDYFRELHGSTSDIDPLEFLNCRRCILLAEPFAKRHGLTPGNSLAITTPEGPSNFLIKDVIKGEGVAQAFGGNVGIMYLDAAQLAFARLGRIDRVDMAIDPNVSAATVSAAAQSIVGAGIRVEPPAQRGARDAGTMARFRFGLQIVSVLALLVSMFMIYNTVGIAIAQRRREIGILRALGLLQHEVRRLFVGEALVLGGAGAILGLGLGAVLARIVLTAIGGAVSNLYVDVNVHEARLSADVALGSVTLCLVTTALSAYLPALDAARTPPALSMQRGTMAALPTLPWRRGLYLAPLIGALAWGLTRIDTSRQVVWSGHAAMMLAIAAMACLVPAALQLVSIVLRAPMGRMFGVPGRLAADNLRREGVRAIVTVTALMVGLALAMAASTFVNGFETSVETWLRNAVPADLVVTGGAPVNAGNVRMPAALAAELRALPYRMELELVNIRRMTLADTRVTLLSVDAVLRSQRAHYQITSGPTTGVGEALSTTRSVMVSDNWALHHQVAAGDTIALPTPRGLMPYRVYAIYVDFSSDIGTIMMDRRHYVEDFGDDSVDTFELYVKNANDIEAVRDAIATTLAPAHDLYVVTNATLRSHANALVKNTFKVTSAMSILAVLVALLGVMNTLVGAVFDRTRELGVLRAIGFCRSDVVKLFVCEAMLLAGTAACLGFAAGALLGWLFVEVVNVQGTGWHIGFHPVWESQALVILLALGSAASAAIWPAWRGSHRPITEALVYE